MTEPRPGRQDDDQLADRFLVDGVAPAVIGGGPPESPFDLAAPEPEPREQHRGYVEQRREPPTSPIPVVRPLPSEPQREKRKSWLGRMFRPD